MNQQQADAVAEALGGDSWQSGGDIWLVVIRRPDDSLVVISDESICEYSDESAFENGKASTMILLGSANPASHLRD